MCWKCGTENIVENSISRSAVCSNCNADLRCCKNCSFYSPGAHYDCRETIEELVSDKERANFCDYFDYNKIPIEKNNTQKKAEEARNAFNKLFGD
ncbi:MAG: hypothetical protein GX297_01755 [Treponema sp.]|jgi:hypothetical protein|nr:hypothetical protein [Treponema sp.]